MGSSKALKYALSQALERAASTLVGLGLLGPRRRGSVPPLADDARFLLLVLDHLGDALLATGIPAALRDRFPRARIHVLTRPPLAPLFETQPEVAGVHLEQAPWFGTRAGWLRPGYLLRLFANLRWIRRQRFDALLDLRGDLRHLLFFGGPTRPKLLLGQLRTGGAGLVSVALPWEPAVSELHKKLALVEALGRGAPAIGAPVLILNETEREAGRSELAALRRDRPAPLVLIDPGGKPVQRWPQRRFARLAGTLLSQGVAHLAWTCGPGLEGQLRALAAETRSLAGPSAPGRQLLLGPAPSLGALAARVAAADLVLSADTGIATLAGVLSVPSVTLFGPTDPRRFFHGCSGSVALCSPRACCTSELHESCALRRGVGPGVCMEALTIDSVLEAVLERISSR